MTQNMNDAMSRKFDQTGSEGTKRSEPPDLFVDAGFEDPDDPGPTQPMHRVVTASENDQSEHPKTSIKRNSARPPPVRAGQDASHTDPETALQAHMNATSTERQRNTHRFFVAFSRTAGSAHPSLLSRPSSRPGRHRCPIPATSLCSCLIDFSQSGRQASQAVFQAT